MANHLYISIKCLAALINSQGPVDADESRAKNYDEERGENTQTQRDEQFNRKFRRHLLGPLLALNSV